MDDRNKCGCGATKNLSLQPTFIQMYFGGFRPRMMEYRCKKCEKKMCKRIERLLRNM